MKMNKRRKKVQARLYRNKSWDWWFDDFVRRVIKGFKSMSQAMQEAYK